MPNGTLRSCDHEEAQPDIRADVYSATKGALLLWSGELRTMPRVYREAIIDHMFIFTRGSKINNLVLINKLVFALIMAKIKERRPITWKCVSLSLRFTRMAA